MTPLRHLRMTWSQLRRRSRGLLLLLCGGGALLLLLLDRSSPQQQQQQQQQQLQRSAPAAEAGEPQQWRVRQPAAIRRRNASEEAERQGRAAEAARQDRTVGGRSDPVSGKNLSEESGTTSVKRSYVSGKRFVDFDPTEDETNVKVKPSQPPTQKATLHKHAKSSSVAGSGSLSNNALRTSGQPALTKGKTAPLRPVNTPTLPNLNPNSDAGSGDKLSPKAHATAVSSSTSSTSLVKDTGSKYAANAAMNHAPYSGEDSIAFSNQNSAPASGAASAEDHPAVAPGSASDTAVYQLPGCDCSRRYSLAAYHALNGSRSSCGVTADLRGAGQNVISFSFYGNASSVFFGGIAANLAHVPEFYPGWVVRVYNDIDLSVPRQRQLVCEMQCRYDNVDFCDVRELPGLGDISKKFGMIWRFMPLADDTVERFIVRDLDSLIGSRERAAVDDWIASNRTFHAMRDAPAHGTEILGGMWGGWNRYNDLYRRVRDRIVNVTKWHFKGLDQRVLTVVLWPLILKHRDLITHDSYLCYYYPMTRPFPTQRQSPFDFVGSPSLIDKEFRLQSHCPFFCRPRKHRDWQWC